jgi:lipopolysaccharide/colanic/teichoic acid biosynthesis glycosyltransferase
LAKLVPGYADRLRARPGLSGLAQILLPPDTGVESVRRKLKMDLHYLGRFGPWLEARVVAGTALRLLHVPAPVIAGVLWLPSPRDSEKGE